MNIGARLVRAFGSAILSVVILSGTVGANGPVITGHGSCGGAGYSPGVYVFVFDATPDPQGAKVDITAKQTNGAPDWSSSWAILGAAFANPDIYGGFGVTTNVGSSLFVRWSGTTEVVRIDSIDTCPVLAPKPPMPFPTSWPIHGVRRPAHRR